MATASVVRNAVRKLLQSSDAYRELPPDKRREIAHNTVRVGSYMADPDGVLSKHLRARSKRAGARPFRAALAVKSRKTARPHGPAAAHVTVLWIPAAGFAGVWIRGPG
jgi:Arc/MetJ-type ribon-helix-helix transcriptional regulator